MLTTRSSATGCIWPQWIVFVQNELYIWRNGLYLATMGCIWPQWVVSSHNGLYLATMDCVWPQWVVSGHNRLYLATMGCVWPQWVVFCDSGFYLAEVVVFWLQWILDYSGLIVVSWSAVINIPNNTFWALALERKWAHTEKKKKSLNPAGFESTDDIRNGFYLAKMVLVFDAMGYIWPQ